LAQFYSEAHAKAVAKTHQNQNQHKMNTK
jgi:hypothetical protein